MNSHALIQDATEFRANFFAAIVFFPKDPSLNLQAWKASTKEKPTEPKAILELSLRRIQWVLQVVQSYFLKAKKPTQFANIKIWLEKVVAELNAPFDQPAICRDYQSTLDLVQAYQFYFVAVCAPMPRAANNNPAFGFMLEKFNGLDTTGWTETELAFHHQATFRGMRYFYNNNDPERCTAQLPYVSEARFTDDQFHLITSSYMSLSHQVAEHSIQHEATTHLIKALYYAKKITINDANAKRYQKDFLGVPRNLLKGLDECPDLIFRNSQIKELIEALREFYQPILQLNSLSEVDAKLITTALSRFEIMLHEHEETLRCMHIALAEKIKILEEKEVPSTQGKPGDGKPPATGSTNNTPRNNQPKIVFYPAYVHWEDENTYFLALQNRVNALKNEYTLLMEHPLLLEATRSELRAKLLLLESKIDTLQKDMAVTPLLSATATQKEAQERKEKNIDFFGIKESINQKIIAAESSLLHAVHFRGKTETSSVVSAPSPASSKANEESKVTVAELIPDPIYTESLSKHAVFSFNTKPVAAEGMCNPLTWNTLSFFHTPFLKRADESLSRAVGSTLWRMSHKTCPI